MCFKMIWQQFRFAILLVVIVCITDVSCDLPATAESSDATEYLSDISKKHGYPFDVHYILSYDDYILATHRLPNKEGSPAVLIIHGLSSSSALWLIGESNKSLAFALHDAGYDVWLGNSRGNVFSRNHTTLSPDNSTFWNFSWHEIGLNDAAATIDYIRDYTKQDKIFYIGHSQGSTQFWVLTSLKPEYNEKIKLMVALTPVAYFGGVKGIFHLILIIAFKIKDIVDANGYFELVPYSPIRNSIFDYLFHSPLKFIAGPLANTLLTFVAGHSEGTDYDLISRLLKFFPVGASVKQYIHYSLLHYNPGHFHPFDYGSERNMELYGSPVPPEYPLEKITAPVALYNSIHDIISEPEDVELLYKRLPNVVDKYTIETPKVSHIDFAIGKSIQTILYDRVIKVMNDMKDT